MKVLLTVFCLCFSGILSAQQLLPIENYTSDIGEAHRVLINEYGVYTFEVIGQKTIVYQGFLSDTIKQRRIVDSLDFVIPEIGFVSSNDKFSGFLSFERPTTDSVRLILDSLFIFHISDTLDFQLYKIEVDYTNTFLPIQWFFSAFSDRNFMLIPVSASLDLTTFILPDSVVLFSLENGDRRQVVLPNYVSFGKSIIVDSFFYVFDRDYHTKSYIETGIIKDSTFLFDLDNIPVGEISSVYYSNNEFYKSTNLSSTVIQRDNSGLVRVRLDKYNLDLQELNSILLYQEEGIYNDRLTDISAGSFDNIYASEDGTVFHAGYAVTDQKLLATVLNPDFSIQTSFSFELDRALYLNQVYPDERDSILYVTAYEYLDGFRSDVDTIPLVYAIDYSVGGVSLGTLLPEPQHHSISTFPNPASSQVSIECKSCLSASERVQTVLIFSLEGRIVQRETVLKDVLDVSALQAGAYQLVFLNDTGSVLGSSKLLKQ